MRQATVKQPTIQLDYYTSTTPAMIREGEVYQGWGCCIETAVRRVDSPTTIHCMSPDLSSHGHHTYLPDMYHHRYNILPFT